MDRVRINTMVGQAAKLDNIPLLNIAIKNHYSLDGIDSNGRTALMIAAENGFIEICKILVENGADVSITDNAGKTALDYAHSEKIISLLKPKLTEIRKQDNESNNGEDALFSIFDEMEPEETFSLKNQNSDYISMIEEAQSSMLVDNYLEKDEANIDLDMLFQGDTSTLSSYSNYKQVMKVISFGIRNKFVSSKQILWACNAAIGPGHYIDYELLSAILSAYGIPIDDEIDVNLFDYNESSDYEMSEVNDFLEIEETGYSFWVNSKAKVIAAKKRVDDKVEFINNEKLYSEILNILSKEAALVPIIVCLLKTHPYNPTEAINDVDKYLKNIQVSALDDDTQEESNTDLDTYDDSSDYSQSGIEAEIRKNYCHSFSRILINSSLTSEELKDQVLQLVRCFNEKNRFSILKRIKPSLFALDIILYFLDKYEIDTQIIIEDVKHMLDTIQSKNYLIAFKNYGLIDFSLRSYYRRGFDINDLKQEGFFGLLRAIERFSPRNGATIATYAVFYIKQTMMRYVQNNLSNIRYPVHILEKMNYYLRCCNEYSTREEILNNCGEKFGITPDEFDSRYVSHFYKEESFEETVLKNPEQWENLSYSDDYIVEDLSNTLLRDQVFETLETIPPREQEIIKRRFGLVGKPQTLEEVGDYFGVTRERIRQLEAKGLRRLRSPKKARKLSAWFG